jgi:hypothetical protein
LTFATSTVSTHHGFQSTGSSANFRVNGNIGLAHSMGRTWSVLGTYVRDASHVPGFQDLVLTDSLNASLGASRVQAQVDSSVWWTRARLGSIPAVTTRTLGVVQLVAGADTLDRPVLAVLQPV